MKTEHLLIVAAALFLLYRAGQGAAAAQQSANADPYSYTYP
ncbi:hypothetical protein METUNv1_01222 [Methyloversatilis universalis FAM5]|uniref:Uncharacterized protein n=1 Tax=Methyloversatilis universalis (strain ATCC BAA-1314 / DSM 25237 / JCM 13912 / CCUG 52030 / FAM5) TaxID=1000565 RepID=F5RAK8_METUF|nr:hypothetical protein [Methyloversatilis universalis]EGK72457.1 hypothetical protein METUNv1_01222 [Methyloversatilis universalis FAM5]